MTGVQAVSARVEELLEALNSGGFGGAAPAAEELVGLLVGLYGDGLGADRDRPGRAGPAGRGRCWRSSPTTRWSRACCCCTACIRSDVDARIQRALDRVRPYLGSHAGGVEYLGCLRRRRQAQARGQLPRLPVLDRDRAAGHHRRRAGRRAGGNRGGGRRHDDAAAASRSCCRSAGGRTRPRPEATTMIQAGNGAWVTLPNIGPPSSRPVSAVADGVAVLVCSVRGTLYAYRDACAGCGGVDGRRRTRPRDPDLPGLRRPVQRPAGRQGPGRLGRTAPGPAAAAGRQPGRPGGGP